MNKRAIIVVDIQNEYFASGKLPLVNIEQAAANAARVIGAMSHMCIEATSRAASDLGYKVTVLEDACATMDLEFNSVKVPAAQTHATAMAALEFAYAIIRSTRDYL